MDLMTFIGKSSEANIGKAIREFSFRPPRVEIVEERENLVKAYVSTSEGGNFAVMLSENTASCGCRDNFQKGEICKHILVLVFHLIKERNP